MDSKPRYRISYIDQPDNLVVQAWSGDERPTDVDIASVAAHVRELQRNSGHNDMLQAQTDILRIEQRRKLGWKVVDMANIYAMPVNFPR